MNFLVTEAVAEKAALEEAEAKAEAEDQRKRAEFRGGHRNLPTTPLTVE